MQWGVHSSESFFWLLEVVNIVFVAVIDTGRQSEERLFNHRTMQSRVTHPLQWIWKTEQICHGRLSVGRKLDHLLQRGSPREEWLRGQCAWACKLYLGRAGLGFRAP